MKKLLLIPALLGTMAIASDYNYEITPVIGYNIAEGNLNLDNEVITGLEVQYNDLNFPIKPELSILHSGGVKSEKLPVGDTTSYGKTNITRFALNGVYDLVDSGSVIPFVKAGLGYETMSRSITNNSDGMFVDTGAGVKIPFTDAIALKLEALYMLKYNDNSAGDNWGDSNLALLAGINFSFGKKAQPEAPKVDGDDDNDGVLNSMDKCLATPAGNKVDSKGCSIVMERDDDNDGVINSMDRCPLTPAAKEVDANGCCDKDDDNDGVLNSVDKCPTTPAGNEVNVDGCCEIVNLHVKFKFDSFNVTQNSDANIQEFADFMKRNSNYDAKIVGHTDSTGAANYNQALSEKRATAVKNIIIDKGVESARVTAEGQGEVSPMATNKTRDGRAQNRRIEAELIKK